MAGKLKSIAWMAVLSATLLGVPGVAAAAEAPPAPAATSPPDPATESPAEERPSDEVVPASVDDPLASLTAKGDSARLSDEERVTRWAHPLSKAKVRTSPSRSARPVARLRYLTEDGFPEVYVVLEAIVDSAERTWLRIRVPKRPNGRTGWVRQEALREMRVVRTKLVIDRTALRATLYKRGRRIWSARVGVGKAGTPTPPGVFYIRERLRGSRGGAYGPWAFGTSAYSNLSDWPGGGVVGIHGTNRPRLIPGRPSHGCVRVRNGKIRRLARLLRIGTPVHVIR